jgi:hypothetical protein
MECHASTSSSFFYSSFFANILFYIELKMSGAVHLLAVVQGLAGVVKDRYEYERVFPFWNSQSGYCAGVIVIDVQQIETVVGMVADNENENIKHLLPPGGSYMAQRHMEIERNYSFVMHLNFFIFIFGGL